MSQRGANVKSFGVIGLLAGGVLAKFFGFAEGNVLQGALFGGVAAGVGGAVAGDQVKGLFGKITSMIPFLNKGGPQQQQQPEGPAQSQQQQQGGPAAGPAVRTPTIQGAALPPELAGLAHSPEEAAARGMSAGPSDEQMMQLLAAAVGEAPGAGQGAGREETAEEVIASAGRTASAAAAEVPEGTEAVDPLARRRGEPGLEARTLPAQRT